MSLLYSPPANHPELLARLHLFSVLPAFSDLLKHSPKARQTLGNSRFRLRLQSGKLSADLLFSEGRCRFLRNASATPNICLRFFTHTQLNRQFTGHGFSLPVPVRGARKIGAIRTFALLAEQLQNALVNPGNQDPDAHGLYLRLTLGVGLAASSELIAHEPFSQSLFAGKPDWAVQFTVGGSDFQAWLGCHNGLPIWGRGHAGNALATLRFRDPAIALKALGGTLDNLAAVNSGEITIHGLTPLIDRVGIVFERVPFYLTPPAAK